MSSDLRPLAWLYIVLALPILHAGPIPTNQPAAFPDWWFERDVIPRLPSAAGNPSPAWPTDYPTADDYAAANLGQLKLIASKAAEELAATLPSPGAGLAIQSMTTAWQSAAPVGVTRDDFSALNQGQLKAVAKLYYDRFSEVGYRPSFLSPAQKYPWSSATADDDAYALVNLGQLKRVFSFFSASPYFDAYLADADSDGIPNGWEIERGLDPFDPADASASNGGFTYLEIYQQSLLFGGDPATANFAGFVLSTP